MHVHLREWDVQPLLGESLVNALVHGEENRPIVGGVHPDAHGDVDGAVVEFQQLDERFGGLLDFRVGLTQSFQHGLGVVIIVAVCHGKDPVDTAGILLHVIGHDARREDAVGQDDLLVVHRQKMGVEYLYLAHLALETLR